MESGNSKQAYSTLNVLSKTSQPRSSVIEVKNGKLLKDSDEVIKRCTSDEAESPPVLRDEVKEAVRCLKPSKSPGVDNIPAKLLKSGGE